MLEFTEEEVFDDDAVAVVHAHADKLQKEMGNEPPPGHVLLSTTQFLERARKQQMTSVT
jgi:hypothetical protein